MDHREDFLQKAETVYRLWQNQQQRKRETLKLEERLESLKAGKKTGLPDSTPKGLRQRLDELHGPGYKEQREQEEAAKREWLLGMQSKSTTSAVAQTEELLHATLEARTFAEQSKNAALKMRMTKMGIDPQSLIDEAKSIQNEVGDLKIPGICVAPDFVVILLRFSNMFDHHVFV